MSLETKVADLERKVRELMTKKTERTRWEWYEERIDATGVRPGASAPTAGSRALDAGGAILAPTQDFSNTVNQEGYCVWHSPDDLNRNLPIYIHIMWAPGANWTAGTYRLHVTVMVKAENGTLGSGTGTAFSNTITPANATTLIETEFNSNPITIEPDQLLGIRFIRDAATDTGNDALQLLFVEIRYARWI